MGFLQSSHGHTITLCQVMIFPASYIAKGGSMIHSCPVRCMGNVLGTTVVFAFFLLRKPDVGSGTWNATEMSGALAKTAV